LAIERSTVTTESAEDQVVVLEQRAALNADHGLRVYRLEVLEVVVELIENVEGALH
jgi:hypothetical protein